MKSSFLIGNNVYLRPHNVSDLDTDWYQWFNDYEVTKFMYKGVFPNTPEQQSKFLEHIMKPEHSNTHLQLAIATKKEDKFIGVISLGNIDWVNRISEIAIVIGDKNFRSRNNGLEAMALLINHGVTKMNLNRIWAGQHVGLKKWREALENYLAFKLEGTMREAIFSHGKYHNVSIISVLASDWFELLNKKDGFEKLILFESI